MGRYTLAVRCSFVAVSLTLFVSLAATPSTAQTGPCTSATTVCITTWQQDTGVDGVCSGCSYRTGLNLKEGSLVAGSLSTFGELCAQQLDGQVYAQPLVATNVTISGTPYNYVVYVVTQNDTLYALDGDPTDGKTKCGVIKYLPFLTTGQTSGQYQVDCNFVGAQGGTSCANTIGPYVGILGNL